MSLADDEAARVAKLLNVIAEIPNRRIEEHIFVRDWFNIIFGRPHTKDDVIPIRKWVDEVAGTPHNAVDVTRNGQVIFTIPPILDSAMIVLDKRVDLQSLLARYRNESGISAISGQRFFESVIAGSFQDPKPLETMHEYKRQLYEIAAQYGLRPPESVPGVSSGDNSNVEYEDAF